MSESAQRQRDSEGREIYEPVDTMRLDQKDWNCEAMAAFARRILNGRDGSGEYWIRWMSSDEAWQDIERLVQFTEYRFRARLLRELTTQISVACRSWVEFYPAFPDEPVWETAAQLRGRFLDIISKLAEDLIQKLITEVRTINRIIPYFNTIGEFSFTSFMQYLRGMPVERQILTVEAALAMRSRPVAIDLDLMNFKRATLPDWHDSEFGILARLHESLKENVGSLYLNELLSNTSAKHHSPTAVPSDAPAVPITLGHVLETRPHMVPMKHFLDSLARHGEMLVWPFRKGHLGALVNRLFRETPTQDPLCCHVHDRHLLAAQCFVIRIGDDYQALDAGRLADSARKFEEFGGKLPVEVEDVLRRCRELRQVAS